MSFVIANQKFILVKDVAFIFQKGDGEICLTALDKCKVFDNKEDALDLIKLLRKNKFKDADKLVVYDFSKISKCFEKDSFVEIAKRAADDILNSRSFNIMQGTLIGLSNLREDYKNKAYTDEEYIRLVNQEIDRYINS